MADVKIGNVVAWADVPDGALVRLERNEANGIHVVRRGHRWLRRWRIAVPGDGSQSARKNRRDGSERWIWLHDQPLFEVYERVTIVALGLTGQETAADLQRMAEVFEVREALRQTADAYAYGCGDSWEQTEQWLAERLHALGWRKGQTAEDAARLLQEAE